MNCCFRLNEAMVKASLKHFRCRSITHDLNICVCVCVELGRFMVIVHVAFLLMPWNSSHAKYLDC